MPSESIEWEDVSNDPTLGRQHTIEVNEGLHASPFFDFALEPNEVDGLHTIAR